MTANLLLETASLLETSQGGPSPPQQGCTSCCSGNQSTAACPSLPSATAEQRSLFCRGTNRKHKAPYLSRQPKKKGTHMDPHVVCLKGTTDVHERVTLKMAGLGEHHFVGQQLSQASQWWGVELLRASAQGIWRPFPSLMVYTPQSF